MDIDFDIPTPLTSTPQSEAQPLKSQSNLTQYNLIPRVRRHHLIMINRNRHNLLGRKRNLEQKITQIIKQQLRKHEPLLSALDNNLPDRNEKIRSSQNKFRKQLEINHDLKEMVKEQSRRYEEEMSSHSILYIRQWC